MSVLALRPLATLIDRSNRWLGQTIAWLTLAMMLITALVVGLRYLFNLGSIGLQESITYLHALVFMLGAAYTLQQGGHVRVDIFYRRFSPRSQAWVELLGSLLLLLPTMIAIAWLSWDYVLNSWAIGERSQEPGGLPFIYLLKSLLLLLPLTLIAQGLAEAIRAALVIAGHVPTLAEARDD